MTDVAASKGDNGAVRDLYQRALRKRRIPMQAIFELTLRCNLRCDHCYLGSDRKRDELSTAEVTRILDELAGAGTLILTLTGGEVMLRPDFEDIYRHAIARGFLVSVFTNATLIKPRHVQLFKELPPRVVEVSLYGLSDDDYVDFTHATIPFADVDANLRALKSAGVHFVLKSVATVTLGPKIRAMRAYAEALGVHFRFSTTVYGANDETALADHERPSAETVCDNERGIVPVESPNRVPLPTLPNRVFNCGAGRVAMHVDPEGIASRCGIVTSALGAHTDLRKVSVREAWERLGVGLDDELAEGHPCRDCEIRALCHRCPATSTPEQEIAMCETAHARARELDLQVAAVAPMRQFWQPREESILKRRFRG